MIIFMIYIVVECLAIFGKKKPKPKSQMGAISIY